MEALAGSGLAAWLAAVLEPPHIIMVSISRTRILMHPLAGSRRVPGNASGRAPCFGRLSLLGGVAADLSPPPDYAQKA